MKLFTWLGKLFSSSPDVSSKRVFGALGFVAMMYKIFQHGTTETIIWALGICAAMLGLETVMNVFKRK